MLFLEEPFIFAGTLSKILAAGHRRCQASPASAHRLPAGCQLDPRTKDNCVAKVANVAPTSPTLAVCQP
ncbi:hypothetical protein [Kamptonema formosum]|uniref:hypothetical protein n=1 Tax=Kamptonema formosum TaxID=331992 RepID=UPI00036505DB|nr:hypothetical protein [Oscillatoria sp. PCC 10802]